MSDPYASSLDHKPCGSWEFDEDVTRVFPDMLSRSVPGYTALRQLFTELAIQSAQPNTDIVDLGSSCGDGLEPLVLHFGAQNRFVAVEVSEPMLRTLHAKFEGYIKTGVMRVLGHDLRNGIPACQASVILSFLTLQFVPITYRPRLLAEAFKRLVPGGVLLMAEKVMSLSADQQAVLTDLYHQYKSDSGYSQESIDAKAKSLENVLVPLPAEWNEEMMRRAGFEVECIFRSTVFGGWLAMKPKVGNSGGIC